MALGKHRKGTLPLREKKIESWKPTLRWVCQSLQMVPAKFTLTMCLGLSVCSEGSGVGWRPFPLPFTYSRLAPHFWSSLMDVTLSVYASACHPPPAWPRATAVLSLCCHHLDSLDFFQCHPPGAHPSDRGRCDFPSLADLRRGRCRSYTGTFGFKWHPHPKMI